MINDTLEPLEAAFIATNAYFTLKDWNNYSDGTKPGSKVVKPVAGKAASMIDVHDRVLGDEKIGTYKNRHDTSLKATGLRSAQLNNVHTAKTALNVESGFGYTLSYNSGGRNHVIVAVRGTRGEMAGKPDLLTDGRGSLTTLEGVGVVHMGFKRTYESMLPSLKEDRERIAKADVVHFVGHSLGGAVATLLAGHYAGGKPAVKLYTFGSPRVGAFDAAETLQEKLGADNIFRVAHNLDPVTLVGPWPYYHVNRDPNKDPVMTVKSPAIIGMKNHDMMSYIDTVNDNSSWKALRSAAKFVRHEESIMGQMLLHGMHGKDGNPGWLSTCCARALTYLMKIFTFKYEKVSLASKAGPILVAGGTLLDLLARWIEKPQEYRQLAGEFTDILGYAAKWAINQVIKAADITVTILKAILDKMLAAIKTMAMGALTRGPVGLTAMGLAIPGIALMSAEAI